MFFGVREEGTSGSGSFVLGSTEKFSIAGGRVSTSGSSDGGEEGICKRGRFAGGEACRVGEGELEEAKGRFREGELGISGSPKEEGVG